MLEVIKMTSLKKKNPNQCTGKITIETNGDFSWTPSDMKVCEATLKKINPVRGIFWGNHIKSKQEKEKKELQTLSE